MKRDLEEKLKVGTSIRFGKKYADYIGDDDLAGQVFTLVQGYFDYENGLYCETQTAPAIWNEPEKDYDSIYHLFGNDLEHFMDCEILINQGTDAPNEQSKEIWYTWRWKKFFK